MKFWKTTVVIWTDFNPMQMELDALAHEATHGDAFCAKQEVTEVEDVTKDPDWSETDFFGAAQE